MPLITLPDGSTRSYDRPVSGAEIAADISPGLARAALGANELPLGVGVEIDFVFEIS